MEEKKIQGVVALIWLTISTVFEIITGIAFLIWKTKIALFFLGAQTVLWILMILLFWLWKRSLKKSL
ncbi:hypothetical protein [Limosilactobacillus coleohominis]|uniref:hypothetical protein n=1 Tax=Limosilactobacillus coleohominis TaxID=181675 RepID=UPI0026F2201C|nr:hypothetical protein [Limosilactobacillus coleohominis]